MTKKLFIVVFTIIFLKLGAFAENVNLKNKDLSEFKAKYLLDFFIVKDKCIKIPSIIRYKKLKKEFVTIFDKKTVSESLIFFNSLSELDKIKKIKNIQLLFKKYNIYKIRTFKERSYSMNKKISIYLFNSYKKIFLLMKRFFTKKMSNNLYVYSNDIKNLIKNADIVTKNINKITGKDDDFFTAIKNYDLFDDFTKSVIKKTIRMEVYKK